MSFDSLWKVISNDINNNIMNLLYKVKVFFGVEYDVSYVVFGGLLKKLFDANLENLTIYWICLDLIDLW